jgi:tRNA (cmo5U34)-methyltransferase
MENNGLTPRGGWRPFVDRSWGHEPAALTAPSGEPFAPPADVFRAVVALCDRYRAHEPGVRLKFYVGQGQLAADVHRHLPAAADGDFAGYDRRLAEQLAGASFALYVPDFQIADPALWGRARAFLEPLYRLVGMPADRAEMELFLGRYQVTPGGIHREECGNFHFVISGRKRMHVWAPGAWRAGAQAGGVAEERYLDRADCHQELPPAVTLEGRPGDFLYWPPGHWHVGEAPEVTACVNLALYMAGRPRDLVGRVAAEVVAAALGAADQADAYPFDPARAGGPELPAPLRQAVAAHGAAGNGPGLPGAVWREWLRTVTGLGFRQLPARRPRPHFAGAVRVRRAPGSSILWDPCGENAIFFAANGYAGEAPRDPPVAGLLRALNAGDVVTLASGADSQADLRGVVEELYTMHAVTEVPAGVAAGPPPEAVLAPPPEGPALVPDPGPAGAGWGEDDSGTFLDYGDYFVPDREAQLATFCDLIPASLVPCHLVDLCCGEGLLARALLGRFPDCHVHGFDGSPTMLARATAALADHPGHFEARRFQLEETAWRRFPWPVHVVVSSLAIHHLDAAQKQELFRDVHRELQPGGLFLIADLIQPASAAGVALAAKQWDDAVRRRCLEKAGDLRAYRRFLDLNWNHYTDPEPDPVDKPSSLLDQLRWLERAGFTGVDVYWMKAGHALFGGVKGRQDVGDHE